MRSAIWKKQLCAVPILALVLSTTACQKLCQPPPSQPFKSVTETDWRLISSNDPDVSSSLSNFTFLIWHFDSTFNGTINAVQNNVKDDVPVKTFNWNPNPDTHVMEITFFGRGTTDAQGNAQPGASEGTTYYQYDLGSTLTLYDTTRGYTYSFVQFTGSVSPDINCHF